MTTALITGANRGIGLALTRELVKRDVLVFAGARQPAAAKELQKLQSDHPDHLSIVHLDVTDSRTLGSGATVVVDRVSSLDLLINNAGALFGDRQSTFTRLEMEDFDRTFAVNVTGAARVTQTFLPLLLKSDSPRIVNLSSGAGSIGGRRDSRYYAYGASKAALNHLTVGLAHELRPSNVVVTAVSPGWVRTEMGGPGAELSPEESTADLADTILRLTIEDSGRFLDRKGNANAYTW